MLYSFVGKLIIKRPDFVVVETSGIGFRAAVSKKTAKALPKIGSRVRIFCVPVMARNSIELYGFLNEKEREIFELFISTNGVGPKAALEMLGVTTMERLVAAIARGKSEVLARAASVGNKKAARIILELRDKIKRHGTQEIDDENDEEGIEDILKNF